jgi:hypothetical protein
MRVGIVRMEVDVEVDVSGSQAEEADEGLECELHRG